MNEVSKVLHSGNPSQLYSEKFGYRIYLRDLRTLSDRNWLNDNVSSCFLSHRRSLTVPFSLLKRKRLAVAYHHLIEL